MSDTDSKAETGNGEFEPVSIRTPWSQLVVPEPETYCNIQTYKQLKAGQSWKDGKALYAKLLADCKAGRIQVRQYPWHVQQGFHVLGRDKEDQLIYLLDTGDGLLLIDPGYQSWQDTVTEQIQQLGYDCSQVRWVLLTHFHEDHSESSRWWQERGSNIICPSGDESEIGTTPDQLLHDGEDAVFGNVSLHVIATPGHTPGGACNFLVREGKRIMISGDIALHAGRQAWMGGSYCNWDQYLQSLEKLADYQVDGKPVECDILLPGHGTVDLEEGQRSIRATVDIVRDLVARRKAGEDIDWVDPYEWKWEHS